MGWGREPDEEDVGLNQLRNHVTIPIASTSTNAGVGENGKRPTGGPEGRSQEAATRFELVVELLQSSALPLGYAAKRKRPPKRTPAQARDGVRTRDNHIGNVVLYQLSYSRVNGAQSNPPRREGQAMEHSGVEPLTS